MLRRFNAWVDRQNIVVQALVWGMIIFLVRTFVFGLYVVPSPSMETTMLVGERFLADKCTLWFTGIHRGDIISFNDPEFPYAENAFYNAWQRYVGIAPWAGPSYRWGPTNWTKRVIGVPGDRVQGRIEQGKPVIYVNGEKMHESYVNDSPLIAVWSYQSGYQRNLTYRSYDPDKSYDQQPYYHINPMQVVRAPHIRTTLYPEQPIDTEHDQFDITLGDDQYWVMGDNRLASSDSRFWGPLSGSLIHGKIQFCLFSIDSDYSWWISHLILHPIDFFMKVRWRRTFQFIT